MRMQRLIAVVSVIAVFMVAGASLAADCSSAKGVVRADVVAIDQLIMLNRRGASIPEGMTFVLKSDLVPIDGTKPLAWGNAKLRPGKRPRPIALRTNQYDCLQITFSNWLSSTPVAPPTNPAQPPLQTATRNASVHINGMQVYQIADDGSYVGANASSLVAPGKQTVYHVYATEEGTFLLYSMGAVFGGSGTPNGGAQQTEGLFGAVHVEPPDAEWYRSQVTEEDLRMATTGHFDNGQPKIDYDKVYPLGNPLGGRPILKMYRQLDAKTRELVWSDLTAVITGKDRKPFNPALYPCNNPNGPTSDCTNTGTNPNFALNYAEPGRTAPFREFTIIYHELMEVTQALPQYYTTSTANSGTFSGTLNAVQDQFAINYGTGGIGTEILANRLGVGPEGGCPDCKYEEFFLDSWAVGDPAMITDVSANAGPQTTGCTPNTLYNIAQNQGDTTSPCITTQGTMTAGLMIPVRKAHYALYPDDPSNVYHSYLNDHVKFRVLHGGTAFSHVHHQHAHQWLRTPNNNESTYLDSQLINPGSSYTLEITFGGSGNRNHTPGDSIFHCHFYPHFAGGMWSLWRVHDTFEPGTVMNGNAPSTTGWPRALPDAEILAGTPTPAIVPLPTYAMAPMPARVRLKQVVNPAPPGNVIGTTVEVAPEDKAKNPGYPFFIPGIAGVRAPHPPMDFAEENGQRLDGGLPRHLLLTGTIANQQETQYDFSKDLGTINAFELPEGGTEEEKVAMDFHKQCFHMTYPPEGGAKREYDTNGLAPAKGAPYADPGLVPYNPNKPPPGNERCKPVDPAKVRHYRAAVFETDLVFNKQGWHYPQSRMLSLWEDVGPTLSGARAPQPLFFRVNSDEATEYWHTNLVPDYYQLDDFQVRTPTDIIGQHIHLVKFDVTASDGASNGFNYEDGTFSPNEVQARLNAIKSCGGLLPSLSAAAACNSPNRLTLKPAQKPPDEICKFMKDGKCPVSWYGAQTTVQRWMADPLRAPAEDPVIDRTLRTVFTHDHFGPSTHQQTGLYAAFVIEPKNTEWFENESGTKMATRPDGGPTSWQAVVKAQPGIPNTDANTFREFALALQDFQLTYNAGSTAQQNPPATPDHPTPPINCNPDTTTQCGWADPTHVINQSNVSSGSAPTFGGMSQQTVSAGPTQGTFTFNYRNEPLPYRLTKSNTKAPSGESKETDPSYVFASNLTRFDKTTNSQPVGGAQLDPKCQGTNCFKFPITPLTYDMKPGDPYTPLLRAYEKDNVQIRVIVGAHMLPHPFTIQGIKWLFEPGDALTVASSVAAKVGEKAAALLPNKLADIVTAQVSARTDLQDNTGFRSTQAMGISEHFEFLFHIPRTQPVNNGFVDYLYMPDSANPPNTQATVGLNGGNVNVVEQANGGRGLVDGMWGIMRAYQHEQPPTAPLMPLPTNTPPKTQPASAPTAQPWWWQTVCAKGAKTFDVYAVNASITFNSRPTTIITQQNQGGTSGTLTLPTGLVYTRDPNLTQATEPLILHANAGDCLEVTLHNNFTVTNPAFSAQYAGYSSNSAFNQVPDGKLLNGNVPQAQYAVNPSMRVGLNPALLSYEVSTSSGTNIGFNAAEATVPAGGKRTYYWYAGHVNRGGQATPIEFGAVNLMPSDPIQQDTYGLVAGLIVEPPNTVFCPDGSGSSQAQGNVYKGTNCAQIVEPPLFREFVLVTQDNIGNLPQLAAAGGQTTQVALNYKMENMYARFNTTADGSLNTTDLSPAYSNGLAMPQTPVFTVNAGMPVHLHMLHPGGSSDQQVFAIHGHIFQDEPFQKGSTVIGRNPESQWIGQRDIYGANMAYTVVLPSAGGANKVGGDYLYRTHPANFLTQGLWGIICVSSSDHNCQQLYGNGK